MADRVVVDASVAIAYLQDEVGTPARTSGLCLWAAVAAELLAAPGSWSSCRSAEFPPDDLAALDLLGR